MRVRSVNVSLASAVLLALTSAAPVVAQETNPVLHAPAVTASDSEQRVIVKFRPTLESNRAQIQAVVDRPTALAARTGFALREGRELGGGMYALRVQSQIPGESLDEQLAKLRADPNVEYAEEDGRRYATALPNDPDFPNQWFWQSDPLNPAAVDAQHAWDLTTGSAGVVIAVLDTGVRYDHPDLSMATAGGRLLPGYDFVADVPTANDGDGRDADPSDPGDFVAGTENASGQPFAGCSTSNSSWHGTRVSGLIGARTNNALGVAGGTWTPWILPVRVLGKCGGLDSDIIAAMRWAAGLHVAGVPDNPYPAKVENLSLGAPGNCGASYTSVINELRATGVLVVVSAGNEGGPVAVPANCGGAAGVAGLRHAGTKVGFSSLGPQVALSAPAGNCINTSGPCLRSLDTTTNDGTQTPGNNTYTSQTNANLGTSFSAPIVSAIGGLMLSVNGNLGSSQLIARLQEGATKPFPVSVDPMVPVCHVPTGQGDLQTAECSCTTSTCGAGMANANGAVLAALRPIAAVQTPTSVSAGQNVALIGSGSAGSCDRTIASYAWSITSGTGTIIGAANTADTVVVAPSSGTFTVRLTVTDDQARTDSADVLVSTSFATTSAPASAGTHACLAPLDVGAPVTVTVDPATATIAPGASQTFTATLANTTSTAVTWQVNGATGGSATFGTITAGGVFTAPATVAVSTVVTITALWAIDNTKLDTADVTLTASPAPPAPSGGGGGGGGGAGLDLLLLLGAVSAWRRRGR